MGKRAKPAQSGNTVVNREETRLSRRKTTDQRSAATADFMNHSFDLEEVWLRPCGWFSPLQSNCTAESPDEGLWTTGGSAVPHYGRRRWGAPRERTRLMDAANMVGVGQKAPESGIGKKLFDICRAARCDCSTTPRAIVIIISSLLPRPDACCRLKSILVLPEPPLVW